MTISDASGLVRDDATVEIPVREFARLVMTADKYRTIIELAFKETSLNWRDDVELNSEDVCDYIGFIEQSRVADAKARLLAIKRTEEAHI